MINFKKVFKRIIFPAIFIIFIAASFSFGFWAGKLQAICPFCAPGDVDLSLFWQAYYKLQEKFVSPEKIDQQKIIYGAISGMVKTLGDPYTVFLNPEEAQKFEQELSGFFEGIGMEIGIKKDQLTIVSPVEGTPAQQAGLRAGDKILKINNKDTFDLSIEEAVTLIRGPKGTEVILTILRNGWDKPKEFKITRDIIKIPTLEWKLIDNDIAYLHIYQFNQVLTSDFIKAAVEILNSPAKKIIIDLRNNPGGYLDVSVDVAGWFLEKNNVVAIEDFGANKDQTIYKNERRGDFSQYPIVVLINQGTASASEIMAGALKDNRNIKLIGEKSFGKGSVQEMVDLRGGSEIKITIAKWLTPKGTSISDTGLEPDVKIERTEKDYEENKDPQLEKAIEIVKEIK